MAPLLCALLPLWLAASGFIASGLATPALAEQPAQVQCAKALLDVLWTPDELAGTDADRVIGPVGEPDASVPVLNPGVSLAPRPAAPPKALRGAIRRVVPARGRKVAAITFDLCERANNVAGYNNRIINLLREHDAKATFFAGGKWLRSHPEAALQLMADPRFELGNHAWTHGNLGLMTSAEIDSQLRLTEIQHANLRAELVRRATAKGLEAEALRVPHVLRLMRLPYGRSSELALNTLAERGYLVIQWDVDGEGDEELHSAEVLAKRALARVRPGSIILLHANAVPQKTYEILQRLLPALRARGYELATAGELLRLGPPQSVRRGYFTIPGDNLKYDAIFPGKGTLKPDPARPFTTEPVPPAQ
ncbi:MAG TPA: polysaccharide deacetylase family protein [Humidesulfovibrio sp.]|uniref:polysaccharide deacetylase family protein n=1 Tax=Humidesulfovibrio sp. TaxID=2910988 RepID=UPI002BBB2FBC|nr:polysaccharide deacetylase family protein [Humidesulfovibrio sp.]HWR04248.1 polysaccharide deacetylase family protein [Humidesulfovibrio sp.]